METGGARNPDVWLVTGMSPISLQNKSSSAVVERLGSDGNLGNHMGQPLSSHTGRVTGKGEKNEQKHSPHTNFRST